MRDWLARILVVMAVLAVGGLWALQCSGPQPVVDGVPVVRTPEQVGQPYLVDAVIRNTGPGHGEVNVTFRLRDRRSGQAYEQTEKAQLDRGEQVHVVAEIRAPLGEYEPQVQAEYPPG